MKKFFVKRHKCNDHLTKVGSRDYEEQLPREQDWGIF